MQLEINLITCKKLSKEAMQTMTSKELSKHIEDITQTLLCKDEKYCKLLLEHFLKATN